jgi:hypothetical protein
MFQRLLAILLISILLLCSTLVSSCRSYESSKKETNATQHSKAHGKSGSLNSTADRSADVKSEFYAEYTPLTLGKLQAIRSGTDEFHSIEITYSGLFGQQEQKRGSLILNTEQPWVIKDYTMVDVFDGLFIQRNDDNIWEPVRFKGTFTKSDVNAIINYIENNSVYFFNHEEFNGETTILSETEGLCSGIYSFSITIIKPDVIPGALYDYAWFIDKCVGEYPTPDHPLYGLFQMLENDFISQCQQPVEPRSR